VSILHAGSEAEAFDVQGLVVNEATGFDADFARGSFTPRGSHATNFARIPLAPAVTDVWLHARVSFASTGGTVNSHPLIKFRSTSGQDVLRLNGFGGVSNPSVYDLEYWDGAAWQKIGTSWTIASPSTLDFHCKIADTGGVFAFYVNGSLIAELTGDTLLFAGADVAEVHLASGSTDDSTSADKNYTEVVVADESTIGMRVATLAPTAAGTNTAWTGDETDVDEVVTDDVDFISSATADEVETYAASDLSAAAATFTPRAVFVAARAKRGATGPQSLQLAVRSGTTEDFSETKALTEAFAHYRNGWATNPDTAAAWTPAEIDALEFGVKSIT